MDALTAKVKDALIAEGASPATAEMLAVEYAYRGRNRIAREKRELDALQNLFKGAGQIAERQGCHLSTVYRRAQRARVSHFRQPGATETV